MPLSKFEIKAEVLKLIEKLRDVSSVDEEMIQSTLSELKEFDEADHNFISRVLIKEANVKNQHSATLFLCLAESISPATFVGNLLGELNSKTATDEQKLFYINILSNVGVSFLPEDAARYLKDPDVAINAEASKFLEAAKVDPEARIDFLDFYFTSSDIDRQELINSVVCDFSGDKLVNILSPLILSITDVDLILYCLDIIEKQKSLLSVKPLKYLQHYNDMPNVQKQASKFLRKMQLSGFYTDEKYLEFNKNLLADFDEPTCVMSTPDGNSNFTLVISRKNKKDNSYYILFVALNTLLGPFSCFGFSSIGEKEYNTVTGRFFDDYEKIYIPPEYAKAILSELAIKRIQADKLVPYEYFCWERLLDDIVEADFKLDEYLKKELLPDALSQSMLNELIESDYVKNWFFRYSKNNPIFSECIDKIMLLDSSNILEIEPLTVKCAKEPALVSKIQSRLQYLVFGLLMADKKDLAKKFFSLPYNTSLFEEFMNFIMQKSVYEYMLNLKIPKNNPHPNDKKAGFFIDYIEKEWVKN